MSHRGSAALLALSLAAIGALPVSAATTKVKAKVPVQSQIINLSLLEALVTVHASQLAGVFGFIPEDHTAMAMADYLVHDQKGLKLFVKKCEKDLKVAQGVNDWDKQVLLYIVGISASGTLPEGVDKIPEKWMNRISELSLADALPLQVIVQRRASHR